jgi:hypothetical protein
MSFAASAFAEDDMEVSFADRCQSQRHRYLFESADRLRGRFPAIPSEILYQWSQALSTTDSFR